MDTLEYIVDYNQVANKVAARKETLFRQIEADVETIILNMSPSKTLSFRITDRFGRSHSVPVAAKKRYAKVMWCFLRGNDYKKDGETYKIESEVTIPILNQVEKTTIAFYSSPETKNCIVSAVSEAVSTSNIVRASVGSSADEVRKAIQKEVASRTASHALSDVKSSMVNQVTDQVILFMNTSLMHQIVHAVGTCVTAGAGKMLVSKIAIIISKSISVAALKSAVMSIVKKVGITTIAKTAIGKGVTMALAIIGLSANAVFFIALIPIIVYILVHEYNTFPEKLAKKVPSQIVIDLHKNFDTMNNHIVRNIMSELSKQIATQQRLSSSKTNLRKKIFVIAMSVSLSLLTLSLLYIWLFL